MNRQLKVFLRRGLPRTIKPHRILAGPLKGYHLVTSWHDYPAAILGRTERPLLEWFEKNVDFGETWLDVGAHYGYTALALCRLVGPAGRVFAFEPMLSTAGYLAETRRMNRLEQLTPVPLALGNSASLEMCRLPTTRGMLDSTLAPTTPAENFMTAGLDWLWPQLCQGQTRIDGIKIDVQGMELETLRGMTGVLQEYKPRLVVEVHHGVDRAELLDLLAEVGYSAPAIPVEPGEDEEVTAPRYLDDRSYAF